MIGEEYTIPNTNTTIKCVIGYGCNKCFFDNNFDLCSELDCLAEFRKDNTNVIFKEVIE